MPAATTRRSPRTEVTTKAPTCSDCFLNLGIAHANKKEWAQAEAALKKATELKPDNPQAHTQLAGVYNQQRKFDLAAEASANAAKYSAGAAGGGASAEALYNQGVALFNGAKFAEAKTAFEGATKADPKMALAHYQLGMTALNLGTSTSRSACSKPTRWSPTARRRRK